MVVMQVMEAVMLTVMVVEMMTKVKEMVVVLT